MISLVASITVLKVRSRGSGLAAVTGTQTKRDPMAACIAQRPSLTHDGRGLLQISCDP